MKYIWNLVALLLFEGVIDCFLTEITELPHWTAWSQLKCRNVNGQCFGYRYRTCSTTYEDDCTINSIEASSELVKCPPEKCQIPVWSEWGSYTCTTDNNNTCVMERTRKCSVNNTRECTQLVGVDMMSEACRSEICPAHWNNWGTWKCSMEAKGLCIMKRSRQCSTGNEADCGGTNAVEYTFCQEKYCPDLYNLQQSRVCSNYTNKSPCTDVSGCSTNSETSKFLCGVVEGAVLCPKMCGCCENEVDETPHWSDWVEQCTLQPPGGRCVVKRSRQCELSTGPTTGCIGKNVEETNCTDTLCGEVTYRSSSTSPFSPSTQDVITAAISSTTRTIDSSTSTSTSSSSSGLVQTTTTLPTLPPVPTICAQCSGPADLCEFIYEEKPCAPPNNYCINRLVNSNDGNRVVERGCGNFNTCYNDWFLDTSDKDKCRNYDVNNLVTLDFKCTYCCISDSCNVPIRPDANTLYTKK
ncbi:hypothetical protein ACF0H5_024271 [Mactra antiquata]